MKKDDTSYIPIIGECLEQTGMFHLKTPVEKQPKRPGTQGFAIQYKDGTMWLVDVSKKISWTESGAWPLSRYPTVDVPVNKTGKMSNIVALINSKLDTILVIFSKDVLASPKYTKEKKYNKYQGEITINEVFYAVDIRKTKHILFVMDPNGKWENRGRTA